MNPHLKLVGFGTSTKLRTTALNRFRTIATINFVDMYSEVRLVKQGCPVVVSL